jgi:hypothetical protein
MSDIDSSGAPPYRLALRDLTPWLWAACALTLADAFAVHMALPMPVPNLVAPAWLGLSLAVGVRVQRRGGRAGHTWAAAWRVTLLGLVVAAGADLAVYGVLGAPPIAMPPTVTPEALATIGFFAWVLIGVGAVVVSMIMFTLVSVATWLEMLAGYWLARLIGWLA